MGNAKCKIQAKQNKTLNATGECINRHSQTHTRTHTHTHTQTYTRILVNALEK